MQRHFFQYFKNWYPLLIGICFFALLKFNPKNEAFDTQFTAGSLSVLQVNEITFSAFAPISIQRAEPLSFRSKKADKHPFLPLLAEADEIDKESNVGFYKILNSAYADNPSFPSSAGVSYTCACIRNIILSRLRTVILLN